MRLHYLKDKGDIMFKILPATEKEFDMQEVAKANPMWVRVIAILFVIAVLFGAILADMANADIIVKQKDGFIDIYANNPYKETRMIFVNIFNYTCDGISAGDSDSIKYNLTTNDYAMTKDKYQIPTESGMSKIAFHDHYLIKAGQSVKMISGFCDGKLSAQYDFMTYDVNNYPVGWGKFKAILKQHNTKWKE